MRVALDTSVLVAGLIESHPEFGPASVWLDAGDRGEVEVVWTVHAYAETWSVLSRLPLAERLEPAAVTDILAALAEAHPPEVVLLTDYQAAATRCAQLGVRSGAIFDALHLVVAERLRADAVLTLNVKDFMRLLPRIPTLFPPSALALPA